MPGTIKLTISYDASEDPDVVVTAEQGNIKGGHVRAKVGRRLQWKKGNNVKEFTLKFLRFDDAEGPLSSGEDWPFEANPQKKPASAEIDEFDGTVKGATKFGGRLADAAGVYKYTVVITDDSDVEHTLDPMIIIEK